MTRPSAIDVAIGLAGFLIVLGLVVWVASVTYLVLS